MVVVVGDVCAASPTVSEDRCSTTTALRGGTLNATAANAVAALAAAGAGAAAAAAAAAVGTVPELAVTRLKTRVPTLWPAAATAAPSQQSRSSVSARINERARVHAAGCAVQCTPAGGIPAILLLQKVLGQGH